LEHVCRKANCGSYSFCPKCGLLFPKTVTSYYCNNMRSADLVRSPGGVVMLRGRNSTNKSPRTVHTHLIKRTSEALRVNQKKRKKKKFRVGLSGYVCKGTRAMREKELVGALWCAVNCIRVKHRQVNGIEKKSYFFICRNWLTVWLVRQTRKRTDIAVSRTRTSPIGTIRVDQRVTYL